MPAPGPVTVDTPLSPDALTFLAMRGSEALGRPFAYDVDLVSTDANIALTDLLGHPMTVHLELTDGELRHFHGIVTDVEFVENVPPNAVYRVKLRPWLALLENTFNCRIFQHMSVPEILERIFRDHGFTDFENALAGDYPKGDYIVQYRESDLHFVSRLMEHSGIYYYFRHAADSHTLVLADGQTAHKRTPSCETLPYRPQDEHRTRLEECVDEWLLVQRITPGSVVLRDFDFNRPNADLTASAVVSKDHPKGDYEVYDYPGVYAVRGDGETYARVRLEQHQAAYATARGHTNARAFTLGALFALTDHPRDDQNTEQLITRTEIAISGHQLQTGDLDTDFTFSCNFWAMDSRAVFRTQPLHRKPLVEGPQTAVVVGKSGEEIWTDKYGRVKVQFHWDRHGGHDENSSCWVRVAQTWAGANWGFIQIPRIGQEVIVDFLEGDPDRPIITGRVYNANNMPPYDLPGKQTQSGVKSRSTKGGGVSNANEIRFEDLKGSEEFFVQAEKDMNTVVKNNETRKVGVNRTTTIGTDESLTVGKNRTAHVKANETIKIDVNESMTVGGNQTVEVSGNDTTTVDGNQSLTVGGSRSHEVAVTETVVVGAAQSITAGSQAVSVGSRTTVVAAGDSITVGGSSSESVTGSVSITIGGGRTESVGGDDSVSVTGAQTVNVGKDGTVTVSKKLVIDAGEELVIKAGDASITLKKNGDIVVKGKHLTHDASGKLNLKAASDVILKGSKISQN